MPLNRVWIPSPNYSSRGGTKVRLAVVHTAEGARTYQELGNFFANPASGVSSQTGIDDTPNTCGEFVSRVNKPWTQANANPYSTATELCAFASWDRPTWLSHPAMLANTTEWLREECAYFGLPFVRLTAQQAQDGHSAGICGHVDLGSDGGGHWDPGPDFPWDVVLSGAPPAPAKKGTRMWTLRDDDTGGTWVADETGAVFAYDGAPYLGGANTSNPAGWTCAGLAQFRDKSGNGYLVTLDSGNAGGDRFRRYRYPRDGSARR